MKHIQYRLEASALSLFLKLFRWLPLDIASALGGEIGRLIGPFFSAHKTARRNIMVVYPELLPRELNQFTGRMWEHLGRVGAEYASLAGTRLTSRITVEGKEHLPLPGKPVLFFSGHLGNWELLSSIAHGAGVDLTLIYRHTNNPYVDKIIADIRATHASELVVKGMRGGIKMLSALKRGGSVAMLIDQKLNNGIAVPFFGREAMTSPAIAEVALKYDIPIIPSRIIRTQGAHFKGILYPPLIVEKTGDHKRDVLALMTQINAILESWIRETPEQWFWVHRRWPK